MRRGIVREADRLAEEQGLRRSRCGSRRWTPGKGRTPPRPARPDAADHPLEHARATASTRPGAVVLAHELGHHSRNHLWKSIAWYALFAIPGAFLIAWAASRRGGMRDPAAVPLALLVLVVLQFVALPVLNAITRNMEAEADWVALETTRDPEAVTSLWRGFAEEAMADPSPPTWSYCLSTRTLRWRSASRWPRPGATRNAPRLGRRRGRPA